LPFISPVPPQVGVVEVDAVGFKNQAAPSVINSKQIDLVGCGPGKPGEVVIRIVFIGCEYIGEIDGPVDAYENVYGIECGAAGRVGCFDDIGLVDFGAGF
jgi:hypothetical protein